MPSHRNYIIGLCHCSCRTCISGQEFSTRPSQSDGRSHRYRATDILISLGGPEADIALALEGAGIQYKVKTKTFTNYTFPEISKTI